MDCHRFEETLFASLDGPLDAGVEQRMREHAASCCRCRDLPALIGEMDPGAHFVAEVLWATVGVPRVVSLWERLMRRRRLAFEGAYAGTLALFLVLGVPGSPLSDLGGRALAEVRHEGVQVESAVRRGIQELTVAGHRQWASSAGQVAGYVEPCSGLLFQELSLKKGLGCWQRAGSELLAEQWQRIIRPLFERLRSRWHQLLRYVVESGRERTQEHEPNSTTR